MSQRKRILGADPDANTSFCRACGSECYSEDMCSFFAKGEKPIDLCEGCMEEFATDSSLTLDSDELRQEDYAKLVDWTKLNLVLSFIPGREQINGLEDVKEFFDALTALLVWHPDTKFEDYEDANKVKIFHPLECPELNYCMERCREICDGVTAERANVYDLGFESLQRIGAAPATDVVPCGLCGQTTRMTATKRCDRCWELEKRIEADPVLAQKILGRIHGSKTSRKKAAAVRKNGLLGGRPKKKQECLNSPTGEHHGYWIQKGVSFRCYHCGFQFKLSEMKKRPPARNIEDWKGSGKA